MSTSNNELQNKELTEFVSNIKDKNDLERKFNEIEQNMEELKGLLSNDSALEEENSYKSKTSYIEKLYKNIASKGIFYPYKAAIHVGSWYEYFKTKLSKADESCTLKYDQYGVARADKIAKSVQVAFTFERSFTYIKGIKKSIENYFNREEKDSISVPSDEELYNIITSTTLSWNLQNKSSWYKKSTLVLDGKKYLENIEFLDGYHYDVQSVTIGKKDHSFTFKSNDGTEYTKGDEQYELAKYKFFTFSFFFGVIISHSWVHFHLNPVVASYVCNSTNKDSVLYKLLGVHTKHSLSIDQAVLQEELAPQHGDLSLPFIAYNAFPTTDDEFEKYNAIRTKDYYSKINVNTTEHFQIPPKLDKEIHSFNVLDKYYNAVSKFVDNVGPYIDTEELNDFAKNVEEHIPVIKDKNIKPLDLLKTFIWQVSIAHNLAHCTYYKAFYKFDIAPSKKLIEDIENDQKLIDIVDKEYFLKSKNLLDMFIRYYHNDAENDTMSKLNYHFNDDKLQSFEKEFKEDISKISLESMQDNPLLCGIDEMAPSISY